MGVMNKFNYQGQPKWSVETEGWEYKKCSEVELNKPYKMNGCFISKDHGFGEGAVIIADGFLLNAPARLIEKVTAIQRDNEAVEAIKAGKVNFIVTSFISEKYHRTGYDIDFVDVE